MKRKSVLFIIIISIIFIVVGIILSIVLTDSVSSTNGIVSNVTKEEMIKYNDIINHYYYEYLDYFDDISSLKYNNVINMIIYKNKIDNNIISSDEKISFGIETNKDVYKYSKKDLDSELVSSYGYNGDINYSESTIDYDVRIINSEYIYYTIPDDEYIFFLKDIKKNGKIIKLDVLEFQEFYYNKEELESNLEKGSIPNNIKYDKEYIIELEQVGNYYIIRSKKKIK